MTVLVFGAVMLPTSLIYGMTFLFLEPALQCKLTWLSQWDTCDRVIACNSVRWRIDYKDPDTIANLVTYMDLICDEGYHKKIAMIGSITLSGFLIGAALLLP